MIWMKLKLNEIIFVSYIKRIVSINSILLSIDKIDYFESLPFNPPFLDPTAVMEEVAS